jgi:hypothetical protein
MRCSETFEESEVEGCEYQDDSWIHRQPWPESVLEEQEIDRIRDHVTRSRSEYAE